MPSIETIDLVDYAVYWAYSGVDRHGEEEVASPVEINVRWGEVLTESTAAQSSTQSNSPEVTVDREIAIGSQITVQVKAAKKDFEIVGDGESDPLKGKISYQSPIGKALLGRKLGEKVTIVTPGGEIDYEILAVK